MLGIIDIIYNSLDLFCIFFLISDLLYRQTVTVNNSPVEVEIVDVSGETVSKFLNNYPNF